MNRARATSGFRSRYPHFVAAVATHDAQVKGRAPAWEMVGYGASIREGWDRDISVARQAEYLAGWVAEVGLKGGAVIVGHDLGGSDAQILAVRRPEPVRVSC